MSPFTKNILALLVFILAVFIAVDMIPAELKGTLGTVIHKTVIPVSPETSSGEQPQYLIVLWAESEHKAIYLKAPEDDWTRYRIGDKLMIYSRDGWITNLPYKVDVQGRLSRL